jgi:hypothetical protein
MKQPSLRAGDLAGRAALNRTGAARAKFGAPLRRPGAIGFAAALLARYGLHHAAQGTEQVLRRTPRARPMHCWNQWFSVRIAPLIRLISSGGAIAAERARAALPGAATTPRDPAHVAGYRSIERLVLRLLHTTVHRSTASAAAVKSHARLLEARALDPARRSDDRAAPELQQVPRVLRQPAANAPATPAERSPAAPPAIEVQRRPQIELNERSTKRKEPALDLARMRHELTREVVRTLDRRVIAHRERMGRN